MRAFAPVWRAALGLMALAVAVLPPRVTAQMNTTTVQGTVYRADGTPASGTLLVSWSAFTTPQNQAVAAGNLSAAIGTDGFLSVNLTPNAAALPAGSYYTAVYHLSDGTVNQEYWVVPATATATIASVRAQLEPSTVAVQGVSQAYVESAISSLSGTWLPLAGGTLTGPLTLNADPTAQNQAATKHYADQLAAANLPLSGGTLTGAPGINVVNPASPSWVSSGYQQSVALPVQAVFNGISTLTQPYPFYAPRNINALFTATGQNLGQTPVGPGGWSEHEPDSMTATNNAPGWLINFHTLTQAAPGDFSDRYVLMNWYLGMQAGTDEGAHIDGGGVSEPTVTYTGTITSGGAAGTTSVKVNCTADCNNPGDNRQMLDTSQVVLTGTVVSHTPETSTSPEIYSISVTSGSLPVSTAIGTLVSACGPSSSQWPVGAQTVTVSCLVSVSSGTFAVNDWVSFSTNFHEVAQVMAATGLSGGQQTLTFNLRHAHAPGPVYANGCAGCYVVFTANLGNGNLKYPITVVGAASTTAMLTVPFVETNGLSSAFSSYSGNLAHGGSQAFTVYRGAEVLDVQDASNNYAVDGTFGVEPTPTTWNSGDTIEIEHEPTFNLLAHDLHMNLQNPGAVGGGDMGGWAAYTTWLSGSGIVGEGFGNFYGDINVSQAAYAAENQESYTNYAYQAPPSFMRANGWFDGLLESQYAPRTGVVFTGCPMNAATGRPDCTQTGVSYDLWSMSANSTAGHSCVASFVPATNTLNFTGCSGGWNLASSFRTQGAITGATINGEVTVDGVAYTTVNAAWNAAVSLANSTGQNQTLRLGPGTFPVTATLTEPSNGACVNLLGSAGSTVNADSAQIATTLTVPGALGGDVIYLGNTVQAQGCTFRDLNILASGNAAHGFELQWFRGVVIDNVTVNDTTAEGILLGEENTEAGHQANFLLRNVTVSYSSAAFTPANRSAYGIHLQKTAIDSHLDDVIVRNALTAAVYNEGTGNTGYLIHGFGYPYTCTTAPCANNTSSASAANASYATSYVIYDTGGSGSVWTDTYLDSPAVAGFYVGADGVEIHGGHIQWPDLTSFPAANLAYVAANVSNNLLIADVDCLEMASGVNWITYAGTSGNPPTYASVHHLTGCGNYYQALEDAETTGFSSGGANINDPSSATPRVWSTPIAAAANYPAYSAQMYTGDQGDAFQAHFSGVNPFFNITYQGTIRSNGGIALNTVINTASTLTLTAANKNVIANAASGAQTITLPSCYTPLLDRASPTGLEFTVVKSDTSANTVTLQTTNSQLMYSQGTSATTLVLSSPSTQTLVCGPDYNWYVTDSSSAAVSGSFSQLSGQASNSQLPATLTASTTGNASTATALAATPVQCAAGTYSTGITANGTANCSQSWHFTWFGYFNGTFAGSTNVSQGATWAPTASIAITRFDYALGTDAVGCTTYPVIGVYDKTAATWLKTFTIPASSYTVTNAVSGVTVTAGHQLTMGTQTAAVGCSSNPANAQITVEYTMNQ